MQEEKKIESTEEEENTGTCCKRRKIDYEDSIVPTQEVYLPSEIKEHILSFLQLKEIIHMCMVDHSWRTQGLLWLLPTINKNYKKFLSLTNSYVTSRYLSSLGTLKAENSEEDSIQRPSSVLEAMEILRKLKAKLRKALDGNNISANSMAQMACGIKEGVPYEYRFFFSSN